MDSSGNLYGTASQGGAYGGTVFELAKGSGMITTLASFNGTNGVEPLGGLIMDSSGNLYGTTEYGGPDFEVGAAAGTVFELAQGSGTITTLASFNGANGLQPHAGLIMDDNGNLYGTTFAGGAFGAGTVFELANTAALSVASTFNATLLQNVTSGSIKLATFNESGGSANAADYTATVNWGDGTSSSSADSNPAVTVAVSGGQVVVYGTHTFATAGLAYPTVTLAYGGASVSTTANAISIDVSADVTPKIGASATPYYYSPITKLTTSTLTVTNTGATSLTGEFYLVLQGLTPGVTLQTATITVGSKTYTLTIDKTGAGDPMIVLPPSLLSTLGAGQSFKIGLTFSNPSNKLIKDSTKLFSDPLDTL